MPKGLHPTNEPKWSLETPAILSYSRSCLFNFVTPFRES